MDMMTEEDLRKILVKWYGEQAKHWQLNENLMLKVAEVIEKSGECSAVFQYVPKPTGVFGAASSAKSAAVAYAKQLISAVAKDDHSIFCIRRKALEMRSDVQFLTY